MSTLQAIERATRSLPRGEQEKLMVFLSGVILEKEEPKSAPGILDGSAMTGLHPELQFVTGIIPPEALADDVHLHRLLKHS